MLFYLCKSRETVVNLIASTTTAAGLTVKAVLDENEYEKGKEVSDDDFASIPLILISILSGCFVFTAINVIAHSLPY